MLGFAVFAATSITRLTNYNAGDIELSGWTGFVAARLTAGERPYVDFVTPLAARQPAFAVRSRARHGRAALDRRARAGHWLPLSAGGARLRDRGHGHVARYGVAGRDRHARATGRLIARQRVRSTGTARALGEPRVRRPRFPGVGTGAKPLLARCRRVLGDSSWVRVADRGRRDRCLGIDPGDLGASRHASSAPISAPGGAA